jgi:hypothetical protein
MIWLLPLACVLVGLTALTVLAGRLRREIEPTVVLVDRFGREHRVAMQDAVERLQAPSAQIRQRLSGD